MKKNDLKNGYVVDLRVNGYRRVVLFNELLIDGTGGYERASSLIEKYRDDLTHRSDSNLDIMKVYDEGMDLIWEREEVDWNKVPIGAEILFSSDGKKYTEGLFIKKDCDKFIICDDIENRLFSAWEYCKLAENLKERVSYGQMIKELDELCDKYYEESGTCHGCECFNRDGMCNKNKLVDNNFTITRK